MNEIDSMKAVIEELQTENRILRAIIRSSDARLALEKELVVKLDDKNIR